MFIDDFRTGAYTSPLLYSGMDGPNHQLIGTHPDVPIRTTVLWHISPASAHPSTLDVGHDGLSVATGPDVLHKLLVVYGKGEDGLNDFLDLDLSNYTGFRVQFDFTDNPLHVHLSYYSDSGAKHSGVPRPTEERNSPFPLDFPFADFARSGLTTDLSPNPADVDIIALQVWSGSYRGANDYRILSFEVY